MNSASDFRELTLSKDALICFALATLRMMDVAQRLCSSAAMTVIATFSVNARRS